MSERLWTICPYVDLPEMTAQAVDDILAQEGVRTEVLLISNGSSQETRAYIEARQRLSGPRPWGSRVHTWFHHPPLLTLNATWNCALDFCWAAGAEVAWVVNNDVRLHPSTARHLLWALDGGGEAVPPLPIFVSAVGVRPSLPEPYEVNLEMHGGPDFSCYLISKECHLKYRFDESFTYFGDNAYVRDIWLGGDGNRIFSVSVPYLHYGSQTVKNAAEDKKPRYQALFDAHREIYIQKYGGLPHNEKYLIPYDPNSAVEGVGTPGGCPGDAPSIATPNSPTSD